VIQWDRRVQGYTVKSYYNFVKNVSYNKSQMTGIWKLQAPPRILVFDRVVNVKDVMFTSENSGN
jgi:hypothetical protein